MDNYLINVYQEIINIPFGNIKLTVFLFIFINVGI